MRRRLPDRPSTTTLDWPSKLTRRTTLAPFVEDQHRIISIGEDADGRAGEALTEFLDHAIGQG